MLKQKIERLITITAFFVFTSLLFVLGLFQNLVSENINQSDSNQTQREEYILLAGEAGEPSCKCFNRNS